MFFTSHKLYLQILFSQPPSLFTCTSFSQCLPRMSHLLISSTPAVQATITCSLHLCGACQPSTTCKCQRSSVAHYSKLMSALLYRTFYPVISCRLPSDVRPLFSISESRQDDLYWSFFFYPKFLPKWDLGFMLFTRVFGGCGFGGWWVAWEGYALYTSALLTCHLPSLSFSYRPTLPIWYIAQELEFDSTEDCVAFLTELGVVLDPASQVMDCKLSVSKLSWSCYRYVAVYITLDVALSYLYESALPLPCILTCRYNYYHTSRST